MQVLVDLRRRPIPTAITGGGGGRRFPNLGPLGLAAVGARGPLGWEHGEEAPGRGGDLGGVGREGIEVEWSGG